MFTPGYGSTMRQRPQVTNQPEMMTSLSSVIAIAFSLSINRREYGWTIIYEEKPTMIQLCPWFVSWIKERKYKLGKDAMNTLIGKSLITISESKAPFGFAQIDSFSLLDKVLLHEMTHGRSAYMMFDEDEDMWREGLIDAIDRTGWFGLGILGAPSYGWKHCVSLARRGEPLGGENAPDNNADTLALFGSICKLMDDQNNPRTVDDRGRIVPLV
ncbi:hypothetical protein BKA63DRAFT_73050 [Paraphoma chrysanthemicola]|nr:hypothetical protein BKA63DRAFT_73050 [Paraphoma chrysanthemicola]